MIKNNFRILKKPHANLQTIAKAPVKFQKDWPKTVGGVEGTRYLLKIQNHAPRTTHYGKPKTVSLRFSSKRRGTTTKVQISLRICTFVVHCLDSIIPILNCYSQNFKTLASLCNWAGRFESYLVGNPADRFSHDEAQISEPSSGTKSRKTWNFKIWTYK